jgi:hypothetical protein
MNYCFPDWPSDFTWQNSYSRIKLLSSWARGLPRAMPSVYLLKGIVGGEDGVEYWQAVRGELDTSMPEATSVKIIVTLKSGKIITVKGLQQILCNGITKGIQAQLPDSPSNIKVIKVVDVDSVYEVPGKGLTDTFDKFFMLYGK